MSRGTAKKKWALALVLLIMGGALYLGMSHRDQLRNVPLLNGTTMTVVPGIHLVGGLGPAAAYVIETSEGLFLIDSGLDDDARHLKSEMKKLGLDWKKLRAIFLTHVHGDHCGGAERLRAETGARVYAGQADTPILAAGEPRDAFFSTFKMPDHSPHSTRVDVALVGGETIAVGDILIQCLDTPGHTAGSICYLMQRNGLRVLFSGDVIYRLGNKPLGTYTAYLAPRYRGDAETYLSSLKSLRRIPVPDLILPGHPNANRGQQSPRITQEEWEAMLDDGIFEMGQLVARYKTDGDGFLDGVPKQLLPNLFYLGDFQEAAVYGLFAESRFFLIDAPGGAGLREFLDKKLKELGLKSTTPYAVLLTACGTKETAGLNELIEQDGCHVVASEAGFETIKQRCPPQSSIILAHELPGKNWFNVTPIPLDGIGIGPVAYLFRWHNKTVLFSGRIPPAGDPMAMDELFSNRIESGARANEFMRSLRRLAHVNPDLWLPAVPKDAQNARVYNSAWNSILETNFRSVAERRPDR